MLPLDVEPSREPAKERDAKLGLLLSQRRDSLLQQLDRVPRDSRPGPPARLLVAHRRAREQLAVFELAADLRGRGERVERL